MVADQQTQDSAKAQAEYEHWLQTPTTATWAISQDDFRRMVRTGEHEVKPEEAGAQSAAPAKPAA